MLPDQGAGGPLERSRRTLSTSAPGANPEAEPMEETKVQMKKPSHDESTANVSTQPSQKSPRLCEAAPRATSSGTTDLSQNPSNTSPAHTPSPEPATSTRPGRSSTPTPWPAEPPVTRATLSELDVSKIIHNPKLRHDINFDPELHFRPNLDGEKGRKKQDRANHFWKALKKELAEFITDRPSFYEKHGQSDDWTLPSLLKAVKEIIQTLVPQRDRQFLDEGLNVELLMQQFHKGIADLEKLALWLSRVLKSHCAPMRDDWVDTMYTQLSNGNRESNLDELVTGMRSLLSVLEAMKLDVANHQIRCLRPVLIEDTSNFEQKFFYKKIQSSKVDIEPAKVWYRDAERRYSHNAKNASQIFGDSAVFFEGLSRLVLPSSSDRRVPSIFLFDEERLGKLRSDVLDAINLDICMRMYEDLERVGRCNVPGMFSTQALDEATLKRASSCSMEFNFNTPPSTSRPSSLVFSSAGSACSSPRSSLVLPSYVAPDHNESRTKARNLYNTLVALLQSAPSNSRQGTRWQVMAPSMALQIFRFTNAPSEMLADFEERLMTNVCKVRAPFYQEVEQAFHSKFMAELGSRVREFKVLSGVSLFAVATGGRVQNSSSSSSSSGLHSGRERDHADTSMRDGQEEGGLEDMATRLAHLGVLHWRVWAQMAYTPDEGMESMENMSLDVPPRV